MDWDKLRTFHAVAKAGSFTRAGHLLNLSQSAVSRQISTLEGSLGTALFHRHARGLRLTEQGETLYRVAREVSAQLTAAESELTDSRQQPRGDLRVTTTVGFGSTWLTPRLQKFSEVYPDVRIHLNLTDEELDLSSGEADAAIRMAAITHPGLIQRRLTTVHYNLYAGPGYLARREPPKEAADLDHHDLVVYGEPAPSPIRDINWPLRIGAAKGAKRKAILQVNNVYGIKRAVESGLGIGPIPAYMVSDDSNLVQVLPGLKVPNFPVYFVYPEAMRGSNRIRVFLDFLIDQLKTGRI